MVQKKNKDRTVEKQWENWTLMISVRLDLVAITGNIFDEIPTKWTTPIFLRAIEELTRYNDIGMYLF